MATVSCCQDARLPRRAASTDIFPAIGFTFAKTSTIIENSFVGAGLTSLVPIASLPCQPSVLAAWDCASYWPPPSSAQPTFDIPIISIGIADIRIQVKSLFRLLGPGSMGHTPIVKELEKPSLPKKIEKEPKTETKTKSDWHWVWDQPFWC